MTSPGTTVVPGAPEASTVKTVCLARARAPVNVMSVPGSVLAGGGVVGRGLGGVPLASGGRVRGVRTATPIELLVLRVMAGTLGVSETAGPCQVLLPVRLRRAPLPPTPSPL